jgi:glyoxylate/hydroxypyruvate reductase A
MALLIKCDDENEEFVSAFRKLAPDLEVRMFPDIGDGTEITDAFVFAPPDELFEKLPNLRAVFSRWTGVGHINLSCVPAHIPVIRMTDPSMQSTMRAHVVQQVLACHGQSALYQKQQNEKRWKCHDVVPPYQRDVGFLGLGVLGLPCAISLKDLGFNVSGWSRTPRSLDGISCFSGSTGLADMLMQTDILVSILPLTDETDGIINAQLLSLLPRGASVVNVGRGEHVVETDLIEALDSGHISSAALDVFDVEPLPPEHAYWSHQNIILTPHVATTSQPTSAAGFVLENIRRVVNGDDPSSAVDMGLGY